MAADWRLLQTARAPVIRFYRWNQPTLSLGRRQADDPPDVLDQLPDDLAVTVRPTGGGYLLHGDEITYSLTVPCDHPLGSLSIHDFYGCVRDTFLSALREAGLVTESRRGEGDGGADSCLASPAAHEPVQAGDKWMAAAQVRRRSGILQHGSLFWSASGWPDALPDRPFFLEQHAVDTTRRRLRDRLIGALARDLFDGGTGRLLRRGRSEARDVETSRERFVFTGR